MKPITKPIAVLAHTKPEYSAVLRRLKSMGFKHASGHSHEALMRTFADYPVFNISRLSDMAFSRNAAVDCFPNLIPAAQFLAEYGANEAVACEVPSEPETPLNPPNFTVDTGGNKTLSRIVQELAFAVGIGWPKEIGSDGPVKKLETRDFRYINVNRVGDEHYHDNTLYRPPCPGPDEGPVYDAATQMGEIVRLFSTPVEPPVPPAPTPPELYGYKAVYAAGEDTVDFGCAHISVNLLQCVRAVMEKPQPGTRTVAEVVLSSGKILTRAHIEAILGYIAAVDEYAKKYPQKS